MQNNKKTDYNKRNQTIPNTNTWKSSSEQTYSKTGVMKSRSTDPSPQGDLPTVHHHRIYGSSATPGGPHGVFHPHLWLLKAPGCTLGRVTKPLVSPLMPLPARDFCLTLQSANYSLMFNFRHFIPRFYFTTSFMIVMHRCPVFIVVGTIEIFWWWLLPTAIHKFHSVHVIIRLKDAQIKKNIGS